MELKKSAFVVASCVLTLSTLTYAVVGRVIYGDDNRIDIFKANPNVQKISRSMAALITPNALSVPKKDPLTGEITYDLNQNILADDGICATELFANQPIAALCSGFLVGPDLLVTAGHCVQAINCENQTWVFDYQWNPKSQSAGIGISEKSIYRCKQVINSQLTSEDRFDHGLIQLERVVEDREPLKFRQQGKIDSSLEVAVIGYPSGLPLKYSAGANIRNNNNDSFFVANLDTFHGSSGSAVVNTKDLMIEGILVRGEEDYKYDPIRDCSVAYKCENNNCRGEDVSRITGILELRSRDFILSEAKNGNLVSLSSYVDEGGYIDMYDNQRESILMKAIRGGQIQTVRYLLEKKADFMHLNLKGETPLHLAAQLNQLQITRDLLKAGARVNATDKLGLRPIDYTSRIFDPFIRQALRRALTQTAAPSKPETIQTAL